MSNNTEQLLRQRQTTNELSSTTALDSETETYGVMAGDGDDGSESKGHRGSSGGGRSFLEANTKGFLGLFVAANAFGILSLILVLTWCSSYLGGFGWTNPRTRFNWHPLLMILGFVFFYGNGMMIYRLLRHEPKPFLKWLHAGINATAFVCALCAQIAVFSFHNEANIPNLYSLHSWIGVLTMTVYAGNLIGGSFVFLFPGSSPSLRSLVLPFHVFGGVAVLALITVSVISGITEKALFIYTGGKGYADLPSQAVVFNFLGVFVVLFALTTAFVVTRPEYKRRPLPAETVSQVPMEETSH